MRLGLRICVLSLGCLVLGGCKEEGLELAVDLRTDYAAGVEVSLVRTDLVTASGPSSLSQERAISRGDALVVGQRIAEYAGLERGDVTLRVRVFDPTGATRATRTVRVVLHTSQAVTVLVTHRCDATSCPEAGAPDATECVGGRCVLPDCSPENPTACPPPQCTADADCAPAAIACARSACAAGTCLLAPEDSRCGAGEYCAPTSGCLPVPAAVDASIMDAGRTDAGRIDAGATDAGRRDAGSMDAWVEAYCPDAGPGADLDGGGTRTSPVVACMPASIFRGTTCGLPADCSACGGVGAPSAVFVVPPLAGDSVIIALPPGFGWFAFDPVMCTTLAMSCDDSVQEYTPPPDENAFIGIQRADGTCGPYEVTFTQYTPV